MAERPVVQTPLDRYVVLEYLAEGGMGAIYLGKKLGAGGFEKEVVLKQLLPEFTSQPEFIDLFLREARLTATLDHANIVHTIDLVNAGDEYFIVMEYIRGGDLRTLLKRAKRRKRRIAPAVAMFIARELLSGLGYAHQKLGQDGTPLGIIHRDVSPSNVLVSGTGEVKLTDFGIAKASTHRSIFYRVKGKVGYMSPEQARNETLDPRSDLYSVAVCLYEMLTGERLFVHAGLTTSAEEIYKQPIPLVSKKRPELPKDLDKVMLKALAVNRDERYQTAGEFQEALMRCAHKNNLMCTATEAGANLADACGKVADWHSTTVQEQPRASSEDFADGPGTDQLKLADISHDGDPALDPMATGHRGTGTSLLPSGVEDEEWSDSDVDSIDSDVDDEPASDVDGEWAREAQSKQATGANANLFANLPPPLVPEGGSGGSPRAGKTGTGTGLRRRRHSEVGDFSRLAGIELTSIIQMSELTHAGAKPLVDLGTSLGVQNSRRPAAPAAPAAPMPRSALAAPPKEPVAPPKEFVPPPKPRATASVPQVAARPSPSSTTTRNSPAPARGRAGTDPAVASGKRGNGAARPANDDLPMPTAKLRPFKDPPTGAGARRSIPTWVPIVLLVLVGVGIAYAIAMSGPDLPTPSTTELHVAAPQPPPPPVSARTTLAVESTPSGAKVSVDGQERGCATPCTLDDLSTTSPLVLRLDKEGFLPWSGLVNPATTKRRLARLRPAPGDSSRFATLILRGNVPAEVLVDGAEIGHVTTAGPLPVPPGTHEITLVGASGARARLKITLKPGESIEKTVELR
jgi:serine/threonine protein kinase